MALTTPYSATFIVGDGETKTFPYLFEEVSSNFIDVIVYNSVSGVSSTPTYTVDTDQKQVIFGDDTPAPTTDDVVCIYRTTPVVQDVQFRTLHGYDAKTMENILSKIVAMIQEIESKYLTTDVLQGDPWQIDLLSSADDGATLNIDYTAKKFVKGLYFRITSGNLQVSADGSNYITMPKSSDIAEFRQNQIELPDHTYQYKLQYRVGSTWYDAEANAQYTADAAYQLAETVQTDLSVHTNNLNNPHQTSLSNLTDIDISSLTAGQFLTFNGTKWVNVNYSTTVAWGGIGGNITDQTDLANALSGLQDNIDTKVNIDGTSIMTAPLKFKSGSMRGAVGPYLHGVGFWEMDADNNLTLVATLSDSQFMPTTTNAIDLGSSTKNWKDLYLGGKAYVATINNGQDITVPNSTGEMLVNTAASYANGVAIKGSGSVQATQIGALGSASSMATSVGFSCFASGTQSIAVGHGSQATASKSYAFGEQAKSTAIGAFQFGQATNNEAGSVYFGLTTDGNATINYKLLGADGIIPEARLADTTSATQGQVLTLDSSLNAVWAAGGGGTSNYHPVLFAHEWDDHIRNDVQWLRADTFSWQSGTTYSQAFWELFYDIQISTYWYLADVGPAYTKSRTPEVGDAVYLNSDLTTQIGTVAAYDDVNDAITVGANTYTFMSNTYVTPTTETVAGYTVSVYTGHSGRKIVGQVDEYDVDQIYNATGVAWYYVIDLNNKRFKLPRTKFAETGLRDTVGNYVTPGLPNITGDFYNKYNNTDIMFGNQSVGSGALKLKDRGSFKVCTNSSGTVANSGSLQLDASESNAIYGNSTTVQPPATQMYLYFYVGEFTQTALENTAGITAEQLNDKVDVGHQVIAFQAPTAGNNYTWYRKYADGWVEMGGKYTVTAFDTDETVTLPVTMADTNYTVLTNSNVGGKCSSGGASSTTQIKVQAHSFSGTTLPNITWRVEGMVA